MLRRRTTMIHRRLMFEHIVFERDEIAESSPFRWSSPCPDPNPAPTSCFVEAPKPNDRPRKGQWCLEAPKSPRVAEGTGLGLDSGTLMEPCKSDHEP